MSIIDLKSYVSQGYSGICVPDSSELNPYLSMRDFKHHAQTAFFTLPISVLSKIIQFRSDGNTDGFILIKGMPCDEKLIRTPERHEEVRSRPAFVSEYCLTMVGSHLGELYGFIQESEGSLFNNIRPLPQSASVQSSESSDVFLELHTDIAFHEFRPDFLLLYCLRQDHHQQAKTGVACVRKALHMLSKEIIDELRKPNFSFAYDLSFGNFLGKSNKLKNCPILEGDLSDPYMTYDSDLITPLNEKSSSALRELDLALRSTMETVVLEPGDLIIIDNRRTSHSRTKFKAYFDGYDRWLQRVFVKQDIDAVRKRLPDQVPVIREII
ncbi:TauD/TfdA family dioxygenase [Advenella kashmirensis]|nr:TauD/TfdA family dioxygenase [Advenella kashmirensis]